MKRCLVICAFVGVALAPCASAQWVSTGGPEGGEINSIATTGSMAFAATFNGVFRSTDGGRMWAPTNEGLTKPWITCLRVNSPNLFASTASSVFVSSDNGPLMEPWPDAGFTPFRGGIGTTWEGGQRVPLLAYWKDMITPAHITDGIFDYCDILPTFLDLAGASSSIPKDRYIDGVDQTSFLLADEGLSNRNYVWYWLRDTFSAMRVAEYKFVLTGMSFDDFDVVNADSATTLETYQCKLFNLYLDPKERYSYFNRQSFMDNILTDGVGFHKQTLIKYPPKKYQAIFTTSESLVK